MRALVVMLVTAAIGCGSSGNLSPPDAGHDASAVDASLDVVFTDVWIPGADASIDAPEELPDVGPPVPCEAGDYYITVNYDGGSMVLRNACWGTAGGPMLLPSTGCSEDCSASWVCGGADAGTLTLAVTGRLTRQLPNDGDAEDLLARIAQSTTAPKVKNVPLVGDSETGPTQLPPTWRWVRFLDVASIDSNLVDPAGFLDLPHVAPDNIEKGTGRLLDYRTIREDGVTSRKHRFFPGHIVYSKIRPNLSKVVVVDFEGLCSADMYPITARIHRRYLQLFMLSEVFLHQVVREDNRLAMPKVNQEQLGGTRVSVPPLVEQQRIVAKVDELMRLIDDLEAEQARKRVVQTRLRTAALDALTSAQGPQEFEQAWERVAGNFELLGGEPAAALRLSRPRTPRRPPSGLSPPAASQPATPAGSLVIDDSQAPRGVGTMVAA